MDEEKRKQQRLNNELPPDVNAERKRAILAVAGDNLYDPDHNVVSEMLEEDSPRPLDNWETLNKSVPWLNIPEDVADLEPNTWKPNWRKKAKGNPLYFFGEVKANDDVDKEIDKEIQEEDTAIRKRIANYEPIFLCAEKVNEYHKKWKEYRSMGKEILKTDEMEKYIEKCFVDWSWSSNAQHVADIWYFRDRRNLEKTNAKCYSEKEKIHNYYKDLEKAMIKERRYYRRQFATQFRLNDVYTVTGLRYNKHNNKFVAKIEHKREPRQYDADGKKVEQLGPPEVYSNEIEVSEDWVINESGLDDDVIQHVLDMNIDNGFFHHVPVDTEIKINDRKIVRVKFVPASKRKVIDVAAIAKIKVREEKLPAKRRRGPSLEQDNRRRKKAVIPRKTITIPEHFRVVYTDGLGCSMTEAELDELFPAQFLNELKKCGISKFVDVPVGDFKISHLHYYPHLRVQGAPTVEFTQSNNEDLCVSNSLASALYNINFRQEAEEIVKFGRREISGGAVNALDKVAHFAQSILPTWIQMKKKPRQYDWKDLDDKTILVAVLFASDGSSSHAVSIHGKYIYDANEVVALPLCKHALDYCTSTEMLRSTFVDFRRGYLFQYRGNKSKCIRQMTLG